MHTAARLTGPRRWLRIAAALAALLLVGLVLARWLGPDRGTDHMEQGVALFRAGSFADAAHHFYRHAQEHPDQAAPHLYLGRVHRRLGRTDLAGPALEEAERLAPDDAAVHREIGFLLIDLGRFDAAVERFRTATSQEPNAPESWLGLVMALRLDGRASEADQALAEAPAAVRTRFDEMSDSVPLTP